MRKLAIMTVAMIWGTSSMAQENAISKYFSKYASDTAFTKVNVTSKMFSLFTEIEGEDESEKEILEAISKLKGIKVIINEDPKDPNTLYNDAIAAIDKDKVYEDLMSVNGEENVKFMVRGKGSKINELLMVVGRKEEFLIMSLFGEIDLKQIAKLSKVMKMRGMDHLKVLQDEDDE